MIVSRGVERVSSATLPIPSVARHPSAVNCCKVVAAAKRLFVTAALKHNWAAFGKRDVERIAAPSLVGAHALASLRAKFATQLEKHTAHQNQPMSTDYRNWSRQ